MPAVLADLEALFTAFANAMWGMPLVLLLVGGGAALVLHSRGQPFRYFGHAIQILRGRYDDPSDPGQVTHAHALTTALSGTLGLGNIAGVAVAIQVGGPGAVFWMWVTALVGIVTKFYTCTLGVMYRGPDSAGEIQGGPMYVVREGMGRRWWPLAYLFAVAGMFGTLPMFQANQLTQIVRDVIAQPMGLATAQQHWPFDMGMGLVLAAMVLVVIIGNIQRVGLVASRLVPLMVGSYLVMTGVLLAQNLAEVPAAFALILHDAFAGQAVAGGVIGAVIVTGVRRGAFSNEAGIGTEVLAHGAAKTKEPVREGMVAMLGPVIDTLLVCSLTASAIIVSGVWTQTDVSGVTLTAQAFESAFPGFGAMMLTVMVLFLGLSTIISYWYYGSKCLGFLIGARHQRHYVWVYTLMVVLGCVVSLETVLGLIDGMYAMMAIPTMITALYLAPHVRRALQDYRQRYQDLL